MRVAETSVACSGTTSQLGREAELSSQQLLNVSLHPGVLPNFLSSEDRSVTGLELLRATKLVKQQIQVKQPSWKLPDKPLKQKADQPRD